MKDNFVSRCREALTRQIIAPVLVCLAALPSEGRAEPAYAARQVQLTAGPGSSEALAVVQVAAELDVTGAEDAWRHAVLRGWARKGAERAMFARPGKWISVAIVGKTSVDRLKPLEEMTDPETGIVWLRLELEGWVDAAAISPDLEPVWSQAWSLFAKRCTACHVRRVPANYSANQWKSHLGVMGPRTGLPKAQQAEILVFLQHHASDTIDDEIAAGTAFAPATQR